MKTEHFTNCHALRSALRILAGSALLAISTAGAAEDALKIVATSPSGLMQIEQGSVDDEEVWVVSTADPKQRTKVPAKRLQEGAGFSNGEDEFHLSPNDEWIFALHHVGSGLRDGDLFQRVNPAKIELLKEVDPFSAGAWAKAEKLGAVKADFSSAGMYAMTFFQGWSADSARLLVQLGGGEEKRAFKFGLVYFNLRTKRFELTDYLRKLNKQEKPPLACAEPIDPLPDEAELKKQFAAVDQRLNKVYQKEIAKVGKDGEAEQAGLRREQREWLKERDAGLAPFLAAGKPEEKERRRLLFMTGVSLVRIEALEHSGE